MFKSEVLEGRSKEAVLSPVLVKHKELIGAYDAENECMIVLHICKGPVKSAMTVGEAVYLEPMDVVPFEGSIKLSQ